MVIKKIVIMIKINILFAFAVSILLFSGCSEDYIIGGTANESNKVDMSTIDFLKSFEVTSETAKLFEKANLDQIVNGDVTVIAPSNYALSRYLRRKNNQALRLNPDATLFTANDISAEELEKLKMYVVNGKFSSEEIPEEGIELETMDPNVTLRLTVDETNTDPGTAWDGGGTPGWGYQYSNFMQKLPKLVHVHFKRGENWEETPEQRKNLGYDNVECDQVYRMYISDVITNNGVVHVIYAGDYNYSDHYYYHSLFFYGTREDDKL